MKKRIICAILSLFMLLSILPTGAFAVDTNSYKEVHVNPLYRDVITEEDIVSSVQKSSAKKAPRLLAAESPEYLTNLEDAAAILRKAMESRQEQVTVYYATTDSDNPSDDIFDAALAETGVPTQGDYIRWSYMGWGEAVSREKVDDTYYNKVTFECVYYTTAEQENALSNRVNEVLDSFQFTADTTEYEKIKTIYDYICAHVTYDYGNLEDEDYTLKYTAYAALMNGTSVCQGYAALLYRMLLQEGVDCRLIPGDTSGGAHAWNIVELGNLYYNVDSTWDAGKKPENYDYFLLNDNDFDGHSRWETYCSNAFYAAYPMAEISYAAHSTHEWNQGEITTAPTCKKTGVKLYTCTACNATKTEELAKLGHQYTTTVTAPTAKAKGYTKHTCTLCGYSYKTDYSVAAPKVTVTNNTTSGKPVLSWGAVAGAEKYYIYRATSKSGTYKQLWSTADTSYTDKTAKAGTRYYYKIKTATADNIKSTYSNIVYRVCDCARPVIKVSNIASTGKNKVSWSAIAGAEKYCIYRATSKSGKYTPLDSTPGTSYTDKTATAGKTYYYRVKAICANTDGNSAYSAVVSRTCDCARPNVSIQLSNGHPKLSWAAVDKATKYYVYRATSKSGSYSIIGKPTSRSYTDKTAKAGKTYYYKVKAINANSAATSAYSTVDYIKAK